MDKFLGNITDTLLIKNPFGSWQESKNILLAKGFKSISNEDGTKQLYQLQGIVIGSIVSNTDEVHFSIHQDGLCEIGHIDKRVKDPQYRIILRNYNLGFRLDCPIEGVYNYNYKGELLVVWCHGISDDSARPMILNINNPAFTITNGELNNPNDLELIYLFPRLDIAEYNISRLEEGNFTGDVVYLTYAYVYENGQRSQFFPASHISYVTDGYLNTNKYGIHLDLTNLDTKFNTIQLGLVVRDATNISGFISYPIEYNTNNSISIDLISTDSYESVSADAILIRSEIFDKIKTITKTTDQIHIAGLRKDDRIDFQKYANELVLEPILTLSDNTIAREHSFMPDEVYAYFIELELLDGSFTDGFHIPGRVASGTELDNLTTQQITDYNLSWVDPTTKQFKFLNTGTVGGSAGAYTATWGYWENEETYPNELIYDSTDIGGSDIRNTPIRHHRFPSLKSLYTLDNTKFPEGDDLTEDHSRFIFGIKLTNFNSIVPQEIKDKIKGYRVTYIKRQFSNSLVIDNASMAKRIENTDVGVPTAPNTYKCISLVNTGTPEYQTSRIFSAALFNNRPQIKPTFIIGNYVHGINNLSQRQHSIPTANTISEVKSLTYAPGNNLSYGNQYTEDGIDLDLVEPQDFDIPNSGLINKGTVLANITLIQLKDNLYPSLKSNNTSIAGKTTNLTAAIDFYNGDVSVHTFIDIGVYEIRSGFSNHLKIDLFGYYSPLHTMALYNESGYNLEVTAANNLLLETRDYTLEAVGNIGATSLNDLTTRPTFNIDNQFIQDFPYRVYFTNKIPTEEEIELSLRTFPVNNFYDMPNDKGEIISLRGSTKILYIQHRFSLFITSVKEQLYTQGENVFLGTGNIFDRPPDEVVRDDRGYIGCTSQFSCILFKGGYITVDQVQGKIFIVGDGKQEISAAGKRNYFEEIWDIKFDLTDDRTNNELRIDNPFVSVGHIVGYDDQYNRVLVTKRQYRLLDNITGIVKDGQFYRIASTNQLINFTDSNYFEDKSETWSYSLDDNVWVCRHDYIPNIIYHTSNGLFSISSSFTGGSIIYQHNDKNSKGLFYGINYPSYVDLIFNSALDISKLYQSIMWVSTSVANNGGVFYNKTITHIGVYDDNKCTGLINLKDNEFVLTRVNEGEWKFNDFRDIVINQNSPIIDEDGRFIESNLNNNKPWFEKSNFIGKFVVVRLYMDNEDNNTTYIHSVNIQSIKSIR